VRRNSKSTVFEDTVASAKKNAFRCLSRRDHSTHELAQKLHKKGFSRPIVLKVIDELTTLKLIDDTRFIETWSRFRMTHHHFGPLRLRQELLQKGLPSDDVSAYIQRISNTYRPENEVEKTLLRRYPDLGSLKEKNTCRRAFDFLKRKGHASEVIFKVFKKYGLLK